MQSLISRHALRAVFIVAFAASLGACAARGPMGRAPLAANGQTGAGSSSVALRQGKKHFLNGDYGLAEKYFRIAAEASENNVNAWIGLAASYDRLSRFKLASRAYAQAMEIGGKTPVILNNMGYSQLLQGNLKRARRYFLTAYEKAPQNRHINNNLALLQASEKKLAAYGQTSTRKS